MIRQFAVFAMMASCLFVHATQLLAAPKVVEALRLKPVQKGIEFDQPAGEDAAKCTISAERIGDMTDPRWVERATYHGAIATRLP